MRACSAPLLLAQALEDLQRRFARAVHGFQGWADGPIAREHAGVVLDVNGVMIMGRRNVPSTMPLHTSQLYARNVANLLLHLVKDGAINLDFQDEITKGACVTHAGEIVSERAKQLLAAAG